MDKKEQEKYPQEDYTKSIYSMSNPELAIITPWDTQIQIGIVSQTIVDTLIKTVIMKRVGIKSNLDTKYEYDTKEGKIYIYQPKNICSNCNNRMAKFSYANRLYCQNCIDLLKQQAKEQLAKNSVKKKKEVQSVPPQSAK